MVSTLDLTHGCGSYLVSPIRGAHELTTNLMAPLNFSLQSQALVVPILNVQPLRDTKITPSF